MILPKNDKKYRSVKRFKCSGSRRLENHMQLCCYEGLFSFKCGTRFMCKSCWFNGLKPIK